MAERAAWGGGRSGPRWPLPLSGLRAELGRQLLDGGSESEALKAYADLVGVLERSFADAEGEDTP